MISLAVLVGLILVIGFSPEASASEALCDKYGGDVLNVSIPTIIITFLFLAFNELKKQ